MKTTFHFFNANSKPSELSGVAILRSGAMALQVEHPDGPYSITGIAVETRFEGSHIERGTKTVDARWAFVGGNLYVGVWEEEGYQYLFSFEFNAQRNATE
jgi:hypothetical protein